MPNYKPTPPPLGSKELPEYLWRELDRVGRNLADNADAVFYRTLPHTDNSASNGISANYKLDGNVVRISTSVTLTLTGIAYKVPNREVVLINIGTGVLSMKSQGTESSASFRFALGTNYQISQNYSITIWYDLTSSRWRAISKT